MKKNKVNKNEINDNELKNVNGGGTVIGQWDYSNKLPVFNVGDHAERYRRFSVVSCTIVEVLPLAEIGSKKRGNYRTQFQYRVRDDDSDNNVTVYECELARPGEITWKDYCNG